MDQAATRDEADRLRRMQGGLLAAGTASADPAAAGRGVRRRLARLALEEAIRLEAGREARRRREEFETALQALTERVARRPAPAAPAPPPQQAAVIPAPAVVPPAPRKAAAPQRTAAALRPARKVPRGSLPKPPPLVVPQFWSAQTVYGFRAWQMGARLRGAWKPWDRPEYEASCLSARTGADDSDVPHTDGRCGHPPCGVYCFKEPEQLLQAFGLPTVQARWVLGLVALSGKVVEHEHGYRARRARVLAAAVVGRGRIVRLEGRARLEALFAHPEATVDGLLAADPGVVEETPDLVRLGEAVTAYLSLTRDFWASSGDGPGGRSPG